MKFKCEKCGCDRLEEVLSDVTQSTEILDVLEDEIDYGNQSCDGGSLDRYQCLNCGKTLPCTSHEELFEYLNETGREPEHDRPSEDCED